MATGMPVRRRYLVIQLKKLRAAAGMTQEDAWKSLGWSRAKLQRLEWGEFQRVKAGDIMALCQLYGAPSELADELVEIAHASRTDKPWWLNHQDVLDGTFMALEAEAPSIHEFSIDVIPELLQTEAYAAATTEAAADLSDAQAQVVTRSRLRRREQTLDRPEPAWFSAVIDEAAVRRQVGGPEVMRDQIRHMIDMSERLNVEVCLLPFTVGAHAGLGNPPFTFFGFGAGDEDSVVFVASGSHGSYLDSPEEAERHGKVFNRARESALPTQETKAFLEQMIA